MPVRQARPREPKTATVERREASVPRHGTQGASQAPGTPRHGVPTGASHAPERLSALRPPLDSGWRSKVANPGRRHAPREREGLFDIVRYDYRSGSASGRPRESGAHIHGPWLWVPARFAGVGRDDDLRTKNQPAGVRNDRWPRSIVSGLLFTMAGATSTGGAVGACSAAHRWCRMTPRAM